MLVRLDPDTKSISVLSIPRDLRVDIPGVGYNKMNAAYFFGGPSLVVETFSNVTGLPINHFVETDFEGFRHAVNILGGIYIPVDRRYYNATDNSYQKLDIAPGYRLLQGGDALHFVRFRHDEKGDFGRMQRQQLFLRETQRQSGRWSEDWQKVTRLIRALTQETTSDINSLKRLKPLVELGFQVDTSKVYSVHLEGDTPTIDGISYVVPSQENRSRLRWPSSRTRRSPRRQRARRSFRRRCTRSRFITRAASTASPAPRSRSSRTWATRRAPAPTRRNSRVRSP